MIGLAGLVILSLSKGGITLSNFWYALLVLLATLSYALNINLVAYYLKGVDALQMATVSLAFMLLPTAVFIWKLNIVPLLLTDEKSRWPIVAAALLGVMGSSIASVFFYALIKRAGGLFASLVTYGVPVMLFFGVYGLKKI